jgi:hypothetical protein
MSRAWIVVALCALSGTAHADGEVAAVWGAAAGVGAGMSGIEPVSALEARGDLAWDGGAVGVGARLRVVGDQFAAADWDEAADWLGVIRYVVVRNRADREAARLATASGRTRIAVAAGGLGDLRIGAATVVDGLDAGILADRRPTGLHVRSGLRGAIAEVIASDPARVGVVAAAAEAPVGPVVALAAAAVDPRAPTMAGAAPLGAVAIGIGRDRWTARGHGRVAVDLGWEPGLGVGAAVVASGEARAGDRIVGRGRAELGAGTAGWIAAPFGPLYLRLRERAAMDASLVDVARAGRLGGAGGAIALSVEADDVGAASASLRHRPGLGAEVAARAALPAAAVVQAAVETAWMPAQAALVVGAEARAELGRGLWSGLEVARQYRTGDTPGLHAELPVWQVTAWFGVAR